MSKLLGAGWAAQVGFGPRGRIRLVDGVNRLEQAIQVLIFTAPGQRVMRPNYGCRLQDVVFMPANERSLGLAAARVREAIDLWEPRVRLVDVVTSFDPDETERMLIEIRYAVRATREERQMVVPFYVMGAA